MTPTAAAASEHRALLRELRVALLAEFGAQEIYAALSGYAKDGELASALSRMHQEEVEVIDRLRALMTELGDRPRARSVRRRLLARALALAAPVLGVRFPLRICNEAEQARARWYGHFQEYWLGQRDLVRARLFADLQLIKDRHAGTLQAWLENG